ncbi:MAG: hypothetical protein BA870_02555 [Desulfuromonadales bacterium C00003094]|nr:MAG: hypothetical protein BA870_02555 [Desulfuromonadales bacterium C00003094]OEU72609.1 MAG: hypothetical protein BA869_12515 [Desulfuromonadales bacterium C00003107]
MKKVMTAAGLFLCLALASAGYTQADRTQQVETLLNVLDSGSSTQRVKTAKVITQAGIEDQALYEKVAALLRDGYAKSIDSDHVDEMSWLCKALSASGDPQYAVLLNEIAQQAPSHKLRHYAKQSIGMIGEYAERTQILKSTETWHADLSIEENRLLNMLNSDKIQLKRDAAKSVVRSINLHNQVYEVVATELLEMSTDVKWRAGKVDTMAWLCKALAASGNSKYKATLKQVESRADNPKLKMHASRALKQIN